LYYFFNFFLFLILKILKEKHSDFKQKIQQAQITLDSLLPQNMTMVADFSQKAANTYSKIIEEFKAKMEVKFFNFLFKCIFFQKLQKEAEEAEKNLGKIYSRRMNRSDQYIPQIQRNISQINSNIDIKTSYDVKY
jgi:hypothetical protein